MELLIANTFYDSLGKLSKPEIQTVKTAAFDLHKNPANPGLSFHRLDRSKDANFWSVRVNRDIRLIVHRTSSSLLLCYVGHHDDAYRWAERRKLETHPRTGAAQLVEVRETVEEIVVPHYVTVEQPAPPKPRLFVGVSDDDLLGYGVPIEWLADVRAANEDSVLELADHLPAEAAEALLELAVGGQPQAPESVPADVDPFAHPDALRRFRVLGDVEELARALDYPWEKWTVFLHPEQRKLVERSYNGPVRVSGSAGTGKTVVALHRAVFLARNHTEARILLVTFSETLASALNTKLRRLVSNEPRLAERVEVSAMDVAGLRLYRRKFGEPQIAPAEEIEVLLAEAAAEVGNHKFSQQFLVAEWSQVVDAWQLTDWEAYRDVRRLGRKTRLPEAQRAVLWSIFARVREALTDAGKITMSGMFSQLAEQMSERRHPPYDYAVVDEAQDIGVAQLRFLAALGSGRPEGLFFAGDLGQRIFQQPFSWKSLGVDIRGRASTLRINYRTSHQIRRQADLLLDPELSDVDDNEESRRGTISVFNGPMPTVEMPVSRGDEIDLVSEWLSERVAEGIEPHEIGVFVRSAAEMARCREAVDRTGLPYKILDEHVDTTVGRVAIGTMHLAKGLEFRAVVIMACDEEVLPLQARIETAVDESDLAEVYNTERHLLYVACTRARDHLLVTGLAPASEFLDDLMQ